MSFNASSPITWIIALFLIVGGFVVARETWRRLARAWDDAMTAAHERGYHA
jgi:branched-chain amino acid transport system permease protein